MKNSMPKRTEFYVFTIILVLTTAGATSMALNLWYKINSMEPILSFGLLALNLFGIMSALSTLYRIARYIPNLPESPLPGNILTDESD